MTGREVLLILIAGFFVSALLLIYNSYYSPISTAGEDVLAITRRM